MSDDRPRAASTPRPAPAGLRVLLVEDDTDLREMMALVLRRRGHVVRAVADGRSACAAAVAFAPEVLLVDLGLPDMTGHQALAAIEALGLPSRPVCIALSGRSAPEDLERSQQAGFDHHLVKPVDTAALEAVFPRR